MSDRVNLDNISIVLLQPRYSENVGAAARAMRNMGIRHLVIVDPQNFDLYNALKLATHFAVQQNCFLIPCNKNATAKFLLYAL